MVGCIAQQVPTLVSDIRQLEMEVVLSMTVWFMAIVRGYALP